MAAPGFWDRPESAQKTVAALKQAKRTVEDWNGPDAELRHLEELLELGETDAELLAEVNAEVDRLVPVIAALETRSLLSGEYDRLGALVSIHPGAGGTESQDWAQMLFRMYMRWAERRGFATSILDLQPGDEAGLKDATVEIDRRVRLRLPQGRERRAPAGAHLALRRGASGATPRSPRSSSTRWWTTPSRWTSSPATCAWTPSGPAARAAST